MDRSIPRLPDPIAEAPGRERRRSIRQRLNTPVYASFNASETGMVVDLSELLDLHEEGFAVQTSERLEVNRAVSLYLDLPETKSYIHGRGQVIWSDDRGRGGIRFYALPESSQRILKEWLFINLLVACSNHAARTEQLAHHQRENSPQPVLRSEASNAVEIAVPTYDWSGALSAETGVAPSRFAPFEARQAASLRLEAVRGEVLDLGDDIDAAFQLIAERALSLTGASGAALAFLTDGRMICRASAGEPAPPLGTRLDVTQGLSGECVRSGIVVSSEDMANDPRVDPALSRALGIGSLTAAPIVSGFRVLGLLEVFSPHSHAFIQAHSTVLERLVEMIPKAQAPKARDRDAHEIREALWRQEQKPEVTEQASPAVATQTESKQVPGQIAEQAPAQIDDRINDDRINDDRINEKINERTEPQSSAPSRLLYRGLLGLVIAVVAVVVGYLVGPIIEKRWINSTQASSERPVAQTASAQNPISNGHPQTLEELRKLAEQGDADAQYRMGLRYIDSVPPDPAQATQWFQRAAEQGNVRAQGALGAYYWAGRGVPEDLSKAYFWSSIALAQGDENSKMRLEGLASQMTRSQVSVASQQAEDWLRTHNQQGKSRTK